MTISPTVTAPPHMSWIVGSEPIAASKKNKYHQKKIRRSRPRYKLKATLNPIHASLTISKPFPPHVDQNPELLPSPSLTPKSPGVMVDRTIDLDATDADWNSDEEEDEVLQWASNLSSEV